MADGTTTTGFETELPADRAGVSASRHAFERWLDGMALAEDTGEELSVVFSELASNAAAAAGSTAGPRARAWVERRDVVIEVTNPLDDARRASVPPDLDDPLRHGGRGLLIVRAFTDELQVEATGGAVSIRCRRHLRGEERAGG